MSNVSVNRITNCNIYVDGTGLLGRAEEVEIPKPRHRMVDHKGLGMAGTAEFWAGVDKLEAKIRWASIYPEAEAVLNSPFQSHYFQIRGNLQTYSSQGLTQEQPLVYLMTGVFKDAGSMSFKLHEGVDTTSLVSVYHAELYLGATQMFLFDVLANIYVVNGVDQLATFRANLGG